MTIQLSNYIKNNFAYQDAIKIPSFLEEVSFINCKNLMLSVENNILSLDCDIHHHNIKIATCDIKAELIETNDLQFPIDGEITFFPSVVKKFTAGANFIYLEGTFEAHVNAQYRSSGNGFAICGDTVEEGKYIKMKAQIKSLEIDEFHDYLPIDAINLLGEFEKNRDRLFSLLCQEITNDEVIKISKADYGMDAEECLLVLKEVLINKIIPESIEFNLSEVLQLTCWGDAGTHENNIGIAFSLVFLLTGDYQAQITEDANEYWLMHLFVMCSSFDQEYKEALLEFYLWYIQYEATYETPSILVYYLIIATMVALEVPVETVKPMLAFLRQTNYDNTSLTHSFFPKDKIPAVKKMLEETIAQYKSDADFADDFLGVYEEMLAVKLKDDE